MRFKLTTKTLCFLDHQCNMMSEGCQADISDAEGILGIVRSFKQQLSEIQRVNQTLVGKKTSFGGIYTFPGLI